VAPSISKKLAITSPTSGGRSVGIVRSRTIFFFILMYYIHARVRFMVLLVKVIINTWMISERYQLEIEPGAVAVMGIP
jgi:hypothetical protein